MFEAFITKVQELKDKDLAVGTSRGVLSVQQTERNQEKALLVEALFEGLKELGEEMGVEVYITKDGPILEIHNEKVERQVITKDEDDLCNGMISLEIGLKIKNLDYDASEQQREYAFKKEQDEEKARSKAAERDRKIKRDAEARAEKKRVKEKKIERYLQKEQEAEEKEDDEE